MSFDGKVEATADALFQLSQQALIKLHHLFAQPAHQMVMMPIGEEDVMGRARALVDGAQTAQFAQQIEGAVDGHTADLGSRLMDDFDQLIGTDMAACLHQGGNNRLAGGREAVALGLDEFANVGELGGHVDGL